MAIEKMRVHELAKELDKTSKEVLEACKKCGISANSAMNVLTDKDVEALKKELVPPPPKKRLTAVFRPQNSAQGRPGPRSGAAGQASRPQGQSGQPGRPAAPAAGSRDGQGANTPGRPAPQPAAQAQQGQQTQPVSQPAAQSAPRKEEASKPQGNANSQGRRPESRQGEVRAQEARPQSDRGAGSRPQGERAGERRDGQRQGDRPAGQRGDRPFNRDGQRQGDRPVGQRGDRPFNRDGQRQGDRPAGQRGDRSFNRDGQRQGDRPAGGQRQGDRRDGQRPPYSRDGAGQGRPQGGARNDGRGGSRAPRTGGGDSLPMGKPSAKQAPKPKTNTRQDRKRNEKQEAEEMFLKKGQKPGSRPAKAAAVQEEIKTIVLPDRLTIKELADKMKIQPSAIVKKLFMAGKIVTINQEIDFDMAEEIAVDYDILCEHEVKVDVLAELLKDTEDKEEDMVKRPPVVCVMGHVDHGKTSLLDAIRSTHVTDKEAGGITQHIGAYVVECNGEPITFLDTPGHEAFTAMRMRGAQSTDIAILVVAADDGVMPQTVEAISHAKAAGVEIIVAINKIDKPGANIEKVKQELTEYELIPEDWGGSTIFVPVSAHTKEGIDTLLEMILLAAEVKELKANPNRRARGLVIEAELDKGKGPVATVLVQKGTLHVGDSIAVGPCYGKVRAMMDDKGRRVKEAGPSMPVEILGLNNVPGAGEIFVVTPTEKDARSFAETFISEGRERLLEETKQKMSLDDLFSQIKAGNVKELNIVVKADVQGSVEAVKQSLLKLSNEEVVVKIIHGGVGAINESDVTLAATSNAIIIGFNVRPDATAKSIAEREKVDVRLYKVIYQAIEDVEAAMKGMLDPVFEEKVIGHAIVRQLFKASGVGTIAGSFVTDGKFQRGCKVRISREGEQIFEGGLASLKRFKDDVKEVAKGYECGLVFEGFNDLQVDDIIEAYTMVEVPRQ